MSKLNLNKYADAADLSLKLADRICEGLELAIKERGIAMIAVSGGSTPKLLFDVLSNKQIKWNDVIVTLVDERWVDENDERSNARLVKEHLLINNASSATFKPLFRNGNIDQELPGLEREIENLPLPFDVVVLGMGTDGHTASFFPGGDNLENAVDEAGDNLVCSMRAPGAGEPRVTFTLPPLIESRFLALHIEGAEKLEVLNQAMDNGDADLMPVRHIIRKCTELEVFWA